MKQLKMKQKRQKGAIKYPTMLIWSPYLFIIPNIFFSPVAKFTISIQLFQYQNLNIQIKNLNIKIQI